MGGVEEELVWLKSRPSLKVVEDLMEEAPKEQFLDTEERGLTRVVKEAMGRTRDLEHKIGEFLPCDNLLRLKAVWSRVVEGGILGPQGESMARSLLATEEKIKRRTESHWQPSPLQDGA